MLIYFLFWFILKYSFLPLFPLQPLQCFLPSNIDLVQGGSFASLTHSGQGKKQGWKVPHELPRFSHRVCLRTCTSSSLRGSPRNSGKFLRMSAVQIFSTSRSVLLRKRMMDTLRKSLLLTIVSKMFMLSTRRFVLRSSIKTWSHTHTHLSFVFSGFISAPINDPLIIIWLLIWTAAMTEGAIKFPQPPTKRALFESQILGISDVSCPFCIS